MGVKMNKLKKAVVRYSGCTHRNNASNSEERWHQKIELKK